LSALISVCRILQKFILSQAATFLEKLSPNVFGKQIYRDERDEEDKIRIVNISLLSLSISCLLG
jgi:hypothetical protein